MENSMDWFKGKSTGNHRCSHYIWGFPVNFPLNQSIEKKWEIYIWNILENDMEIKNHMSHCIFTSKHDN